MSNEEIRALYARLTVKTGVRTELIKTKSQSYFFKIKIPGSWKDPEIVVQEFDTWDQAIAHAQDLANRTGRTVSMSARYRFRHGHIFQPKYQKQALIKLMLEYAWNAPAEGLPDRDGVENFRWGLQTLQLLDSLQRLHIHAALPGALVAAGFIEEREKAEVPT